MSEHTARIVWQQAGGPFAKRQYSRAHTWTFDGGVTVPAAASPSAVPVQFTDPAAVDPEEAYVASIASCHMLSFLPLAALAGFEVLRYEDDAVGHMTKNERGVAWVSRVDLSPRVTYADGRAPDAEAEEALHHGAHEACYIANSVKTEIRVRSGVSASESAAPGDSSQQ
jgi:organic hydroperoxide reductase OsmC/OhrA